MKDDETRRVVLWIAGITLALLFLASLLAGLSFVWIECETNADRAKFLLWVATFSGIPLSGLAFAWLGPDA